MLPPSFLADLPRPQRLTYRAIRSLEHFLHIESVSGIILLCAAAGALIWANSPWAASYVALWHADLSVSIGSFSFSQSLHFWINDVLMTFFFLVVGMEIRREIHAGALSSLRQASLPIAAAAGGVVMPALIYLLANRGGNLDGWAVPTATDIAFAVGVLALLGKSIPSNVRIFLLALAIIDDIIAVLIIAIFYSSGLDYFGFMIAGAGIAAVWMLQKLGIGSAFAYVIPSAIVWIGIWKTGAHPTLAGVILGLMTPVMPTKLGRHAAGILKDAAAHLPTGAPINPAQLKYPINKLHWAKRELFAPVERVQMALHPWVAYGVMPLFALANAGVGFQGVDFSAPGTKQIMLGIIFALVLGKPLGIIASTWLMVKAGVAKLPAGVTWGGVSLIGLLAGIGFTMSIFIAMLAFPDEQSLAAAKLGVLVASVIAVLMGLVSGKVLTCSR